MLEGELTKDFFLNLNFSAYCLGDPEKTINVAVVNPKVRGKMYSKLVFATSSSPLVVL